MKKERKKAWWLPALEVFIKMSVWIVSPLILAFFLGKFLDLKFGTKPWIFLSLSVLAFLFSSLKIVLIASKEMKKIAKREEIQKEQTERLREEEK